MRRRTQFIALAISGLIGLGLWLGLVVALPDNETTAPAFWWLTLLSAVVLGAAFRRDAVAGVAVGLGLPPLLLSPWTAPRGDGDGLWLLWIPLLAAFVLVLLIAAQIGAVARERLHRTA